MKRRPWAWGAVVASLFCFGYVFSWGVRGIWRSNYPELVRTWPADGPFTLLGLYGTELGAEELGYAAKMREAGRHWVAGDPYIIENHSVRGRVIDAANYFVMGLVQRAIGDMNASWIALRFLCCLLWFVFLEGLAFDITADAALSRFAAAGIVCFSYILTFLWIPYLRLSGGPAPQLLARDVWSILSVGRTEGILRMSRPGVVYCFVLAASAAQVRAARDGRLRWGLLAGLAGGLTAYSHANYWCLQLAASALFAAIAFFRPGLSRRNLLVSAALTALLSLPYVFANLPLSNEFMRRAALPPPVFAPASLVYVVLGAAMLWRAGQHATRLWVGTLTLATGCVMLSPVITHVDVHFSLLPFFTNIFAALFVLDEIHRRWKPRAALWSGLAAAAVGMAFLQGVGYAAIHFPLQGLREDDARGLDWLRANTPPDSVVVSLSPEINMLIPALTDDKVAFSFSVPLYTDYPLLELTRRMRASLRLLSADEKRFYAALMDTPQASRRDGDTRQAAPETYLRLIYFFLVPQDMIEENWRQAGQLPAPSFQTDYVWIGPFERRYLPAGFPAGAKTKLAPVFSAGSVTIYRIEPSDPGLALRRPRK